MSLAHLIDDTREPAWEQEATKAAYRAEVLNRAQSLVTSESEAPRLMAAVLETEAGSEAAFWLLNRFNADDIMALQDAAWKVAVRWAKSYVDNARKDGPTFPLSEVL